MTAFELLTILGSIVSTISGASTIGRNLDEAKKINSQISAAKLQEPELGIDSTLSVLISAHAQSLDQTAGRMAKIWTSPEYSRPDKEEAMRRLASQALKELPIFEDILESKSINVQALRAYFEFNSNL